MPYFLPLSPAAGVLRELNLYFYTAKIRKIWEKSKENATFMQTKIAQTSIKGAHT